MRIAETVTEIMGLYEIFIGIRLFDVVVLISLFSLSPSLSLSQHPLTPPLFPSLPHHYHTNHRVKCAAVFNSFSSAKQLLKRDIFYDHYLSKSLTTDTDLKFKISLLAEWFITDSDADLYIRRYYPGISIPLIIDLNFNRYLK